MYHLSSVISNSKKNLICTNIAFVRVKLKDVFDDMMMMFLDIFTSVQFKIIYSSLKGQFE